MLNIKASRTSALLSVFTIVFVFFFAGFYLTDLLAGDESQAPSFPSCQSLYGTAGDVASYESGIHQIVGGGLVEGMDNVYSGDGSFVQCYCPAEGEDGIQTNWWLADNLSQETISYYTSMGWFYQNGMQWNLGDHMYLAKNMDAVCAEPLPTPTLTPIPTVTPTVTPTPTATPTPHEDEARCVGLSASPSEGTAPLTVHFTGSGFDKNGPILEYEFNFGDASGGQPQVWKQEESEAAHRYENPGTYIASLKVKDQGGTWRDGNDDCKATIVVKDAPDVLGAQDVEELPTAGASALLLSGLAPLGYYLYKRFKIV